LSYQPTLWLIIILITAFPDTDLLSGGNGELNATIALLILYGTAVAGFTYCVSFSLSTPTVAAIFVFMGGFLLGLILSIIGVLLRIIPSTNKVYVNVIRYIFNLCPFFALGEGLNNLTFLTILSYLELKGGELYKPLDWEITGLNLTFLGWETVFFLVAAILYESYSGRSFLSSKAPADADAGLKDEGNLLELLYKFVISFFIAFFT
jgi:ATP-binding cassette subfamily A (ABC1) protein 1